MHKKEDGLTDGQTGLKIIYIDLRVALTLNTGNENKYEENKLNVFFKMIFDKKK
jgi:hypothetical protein